MTNKPLNSVGRAALALLACLWLPPAAAFCQDSGEQGTNMRGSRAEIAVTVRDQSRQVITAPAVVKLYKNGTLEDQRSTSQGRAFFIARSLGEFTVSVEAAGYRAAQKDVSIAVAVQYQEDVYLERDTASGETGAPGRAVLAPKAKEALDAGSRALIEGKLEEAQKYISEAMRLAPGNPDVLYLQGMLYMRRGDWEQAQTTLEKASRMDPNQPRTLAALGMNFVNQKKFTEAIPLLEKSIQLQPASGWENKLALAKAYFYKEQYEKALKMVNQAHIESQASSAQAELLLAQCLTALGRYEDSAQVLREFLKYNPKSPDAKTAQHWLDRLTADKKIRQ